MWECACSYVRAGAVPSPKGKAIQSEPRGPADGTVLQQQRMRCAGWEEGQEVVCILCDVPCLVL